MNRTAAQSDTRRALRGWRCVVAAALVALVCSPSMGRPPTTAPGQGTVNETPAELRGSEIVNRIGDSLPLDLEFTDSTGATVNLGDYFEGDRPVVINFVYYDCPMLCTQVLDSTVRTLKDLAWTPGGEEFVLLTVSFNPDDTAELAAAKKANYLEAYGRPNAEAGWVFLTGSEDNVKALADAAGFGFKWVESQNEYAHEAALFIATPDGTVSQVMKGIMYAPEALRTNLIEASGGKLGTFSDMLVMFCGHYDPATGEYQVLAMRVMQLGAAATIALLAVVLFVLWSRDRYKRHLSVIPN